MERGRYSGHVIHIRLRNHRAHRLLDISLPELVERVLVPDGFEVENWAAEMFFQEAEGACVCYACGAGLVVCVAGEDEVCGLHVRVGMSCS